MLTPEETSVLHYLRRRAIATMADLARECLAGASAEWVARITSNLGWLGYAITYPATGGGSAALQITERGLRAIGIRPLPPPGRRRIG